ncbi:MAG: substrate-binding domain-containing protein [Cyanobacteria bacterium J06635_15]
MLRIFATRLHPLMAIALLSVLLPPVAVMGVGQSPLLAQGTEQTSTPAVNGEGETESSTPAVPDTSTLRIAVSPSMQVISRTLKQRFEAQADTSTEITLESMGTDAALQQVANGQANLAAIGRPLTETELAEGWQEVPISREKIAIIVSADNPFQEELTFDQFANIFRGEINDWSSLGGPVAPIRFIDRPEESDTRVALSNYTIFKAAPFETGANALSLETDDTAALVRQLGTDGIGYAIASQVINQNEIRVVPMDGVLPDSELYPYSQPRSFVYKGQLSPPLQAFLDFSTGGLGQTAVVQAQATEAADVAVADIPRGKVVVSPDGNWLVSVNEDGTLQFWDQAGNAIGEPVDAHNGTITDATFDDSGETLLTAGADGTVQQWDEEGQPAGPVLTSERGPVTALRMSPDGQTLVTAATDGTLQFWDAEGNAKGDPVQAHPGLITTLAFSPDGQTVASGGEDGTVSFWTPEGQPQGEAYAGHDGPVTAVAFSPDGEQLVSAGADGQLRYWDQAGNVVGDPIQAHSGGVDAIAFNPQNQTLASTGADGTVKLWDAEGNTTATPINDLEMPASSLAFSPDGQRLIIGDASGTPKQWDLEGNPILPTDGESDATGDNEQIVIEPDPPLDPVAESDPLAGATAFFQSLPAWVRWGLLPLLGLALIIGAALRGGDDRKSTLVVDDTGDETDQPDADPIPDPPRDLTPGSTPYPSDLSDDWATGQDPSPAPSTEELNWDTRLAEVKAELAEGAALAKAGQHEAAIAQVHRAIEAADLERMKAIAMGASASGALALLVRGLTQRSKLFNQLGRKTDALGSLDTALKFDPNDDEAIALKGELLGGLDAASNANVLFDRARELYNDPDDPIETPVDGLVGPDQGVNGASDGMPLDDSPDDGLAGDETEPDTADPIFPETGELGDLDSLGDAADVPPELLVQIADLPQEAQTPPWISMTAEPTEVLAKATADEAAVEQADDIPADLAAEFAAIPTEEAVPGDGSDSDVNLDTEGNINNGAAGMEPPPLDTPVEDWMMAAVVDVPDEEDLDQIPSATPMPLDWPDADQADSEDVPAELQAALQDIPNEPQTLPWVTMVSEPTGRSGAIAAASTTVANSQAPQTALIEKSQITLAPCNTQWAYVSWTVAQKKRDVLQQQTDAQLAVRLYDVTDVGADYAQLREFQQHECYDLAREWYLAIPQLGRDYLVELGYFNADKRWQPIVHSDIVHFPS